MPTSNGYTWTPGVHHHPCNLCAQLVRADRAGVLIDLGGRELPLQDPRIHGAGRLDPCAVPVVVEHLDDYDARIAGLVTTRNSLQGLIDASTPAAGLRD
ncbi:hypothetical protein [Rhodococcus sp. NPDC058521]|uniref:hypothetical protein n=1 Tax=Rhodococcus sp. NPDC058521 TaxID=3346536 RepID=UPI00365C0FE2